MATDAPVRDEPLAVELMNTIWADRAGVHDALATPADARSWLAAVADRFESGPPALDRARLTALRGLRDSARALASLATNDARAVAGQPATSREVALRTVNDCIRGAGRRTELHWDRGPIAVEKAAGTAMQQLLGAFAESVVNVLTSDCELRACTAPGCVLFYARAHDRREWCSAACGNRARVARHYSRHRHAGRI
jgi:predicted RNA-binding Zn ribbon-like protein